MSLPRPCFRVARLEVRSQTREDPSAQGLASLLDYARRHDIAVDHVPLASRTGAELDGKLAALAGARELSLLLRECLEEERARRQVARATEAPA